MDTLLHDVRHAVRALSRARGFTLIAVLTIALGIGANTAIYSLVQHVLFRPFPFLDGDRLVAVWETAPGGNDHNEFAPANFYDLREQARTLDHVVAHAWVNANLTGGDRAERVQGFAVTSDYFDALGVRPLIGRAFTRTEETRGDDAVVILTHELWTRRFAADSSVIGTSIPVNGRTRRIVGVLPPGVKYPSAAELYVPLAPTPEARASRRAHYLLVTGRLAPGATLEAARAEVAGITTRLASQFPETNARWGSNTRALIPDATRMLQPVLVVLLAAVGFVLLVACANLANLMLARGVARSRELFVRAALGASSGRLARHALIETGVLTLAGGVLGVGLGSLGIRGLLAIIPPEHTRMLAGFERVGVDARVLLVTTLVVVLTTVLVGFAPAIRAARTSTLESSLRGGGRGTSGRHRLRGALVAAETGIALLLLVGAGLMVRTFTFLAERETGIDVGHTALTTVALPALRYTSDTARLAFFRQAIAEAEQLPGVTAAGATSIVPMCQCNSTTSFQIDGAPPFAQGEEPDVGERIVTPGYFEAMSIAVEAGRAFAHTDREDAPRVAIVSAALARRWFPDGAVGKALRIDSTRYEIVGVAGDVRHQGPAAEPAPELYLPLAQNVRAEMTLALRVAQGDGSALLPQLRDVVSRIDPELPVFDVRTMRRVAMLAVGGVRLSVTLLTVLASLALLLAMVGIYGVASQLVAERTREIGIRLALGSAERSVIRFIVGRGATAVLIGAAVGMAAAAVLSRAIASQLVGVVQLDPITYVVVTALLFAAALLALYVPARRVARVDPMDVLRNEGS